MNYLLLFAALVVFACIAWRMMCAVDEDDQD